MIQVAICDDEPMIREKLKICFDEFVEKYGFEVQISIFEDGEKLLHSGEEFDVIFLDIGLTGMDGIEVGTEIRKTDKKVKIIYLTAFHDYMGKAFQVHAFGYIVKPFTNEKIHQVLFEAITYGKLNVENSKTFHTQNGLIAIKLQEITYFEYCNRSVLLHDCNGRVFKLPGEKISKVAAQMKPYHFEVPHKSFVVNLYQVKSIKGYNIHMNQGAVVPLSQLYSKNFRRIMHEYLNMRI